MQLHEYMSKLTKKQKTAFCKKVGGSRGYLDQMAMWALKISKGDKVDPKKVRLAGADLCIRIEDITKKRNAGSNDYPGVVFRWDMRPDYWDKPKKEGKE